MNKKTLILDLDETLVYSFYQKDKPNNTFDVQFNVDNIIIRTLLRPNLKSFINYVEKNFNIIVWTSSERDYAQEVVDHIFSKKVELITKEDFEKYYYLRDYHIDDINSSPKIIQNMIYALKYWIPKLYLYDYLDEKLYIKDISKIVKRYNLNKKDIIAIDNDPYKFYSSYGNYWYIPDFKGNTNDDYLNKFIQLLEQLKNLEDVRVKKKDYKDIIK